MVPLPTISLVQPTSKPLAFVKEINLVFLMLYWDSKAMANNFTLFRDFLRLFGSNFKKRREMFANKLANNCYSLGRHIPQISLWAIFDSNIAISVANSCKASGYPWWIDLFTWNLPITKMLNRTIEELPFPVVNTKLHIHGLNPNFFSTFRTKDQVIRS